MKPEAYNPVRGYYYPLERSQKRVGIKSSIVTIFLNTYFSSFSNCSQVLLLFVTECKSTLKTPIGKC